MSQDDLGGDRSALRDVPPTDFKIISPITHEELIAREKASEKRREIASAVDRDLEAGER